MKFKFILSILLTPIFSAVFSQDNNLAFAVTGQSLSNLKWTDIRVIDMTTGNTNATIFESGKTKFSFLDAFTNKPVNELTVSGNPARLQQIGLGIAANQNTINNPSPTQLMSAAIAYDKLHNKLFFASMFTGQLNWLDLQSSKTEPVFYSIQKPLLNNVDYNDESFNITRMTIGADGYGYALTNDGNHLIQFTTGSKTIITDLGSLVDDESNSNISVHNKCSSWGGDIVGDAFGKLYLFSAGKAIFIIDPKTMIATYKGTISNLPATFSLNGAAVIDDNNVMISCANTLDGYYKVDVNQLSAVKISTQGTVYNASDLASCNLLHEQEKINSLGIPTLPNGEVNGNRIISIYPNPVSDDQIKITFESNASGTYKIALTDLQGRLIGTKDVFIKGPGQVENFQLRTKQASGMYLIKIIDATNKSVYSDKLVLE
jgi:hypothetical protein